MVFVLISLSVCLWVSVLQRPPPSTNPSFFPFLCPSTHWEPLLHTQKPYLKFANHATRHLSIATPCPDKRRVCHKNNRNGLFAKRVWYHRNNGGSRSPNAMPCLAFPVNPVMIHLCSICTHLQFKSQLRRGKIRCFSPQLLGEKPASSSSSSSSSSSFTSSFIHLTSSLPRRHLLAPPLSSPSPCPSPTPLSS